MNRILLIGHDPVIRLFYRQELTEDGYEVAVFENNIDPVFYQKERPDLVIMSHDLKESAIGGILKMLEQADRKLPVIFLLDRIPRGFSPQVVPGEEYFIQSSGLGELKQKIKRLLSHPETASVERQTEASDTFKRTGLFLSKPRQIDFRFPAS